jgi:cleavage and polyadenylation specificity factor subunit 1
VLVVWESTSIVHFVLFLAHRLHGNVESLGVLSYRRDEGRKGRDSIILTFRDAKISVLEFDDSTHGLRIG